MNRTLFICMLTVLAGLIGPTRFAKGYALETSSSGAALSWPSGNITMNLQLSSSTVPYPNGQAAPTDGSASWNAVAQAALAEWNQYLSSVQFVSNTNSLTPKNGDGVNSVFFDSSAFGQGFGPDAIAVTLFLFHPSNNKMAEADIVVNTAYAWDSYRGPLIEDYLDGEYSYDLRRVLDHELGHVLGLNHPDLASPPQSVTAIMNSTIGDLDHIALDDTQGAMFLYGQKTVQEPITVTAYPANGGLVAGGGNLPLGSTQQLVAMPAVGYDFIQWEDSSTSPARSIVVPTQGGTYTATFAQVLDDWRYRSDPLYGFFNLFFVNGQFYTTSEDGNTVSSDGLTWTASSVPDFTGMVYGNGLYVGIVGSMVYTSTDGLTWSSQTSAIGSTSSVAYGNGIFVVTANAPDSMSPAPIMYSTDGVTWTTTTSGLVGYTLGAASYGNGRFVALGANSGAHDMSLVSYDGATWTKSDLGAAYTLDVMAYGNGLFVASGGVSGLIFHSSDGLSWTQASPVGAGTTDDYIASIAYGNGTFIALQSSSVLSSTDAVTWTSRTHPVEYETWYRVVFGNNSFVSISEDVAYQSGTVPALASPPSLPTINSSSTAYGETGNAFTYQISASNGSLAFNAIGLPAGLSVNVQTGAITGTPTQTGTYPVTLFATNDAGSRTATLTLAITVAATPVSFSSWMTANNVTGGAAGAPHGDGLPNLLKYVYDIDPKVFLTATTRASLPVLATASSDTVLTLTFPENKALTGVDVAVETSSDLKSWSTTGSTITPTGETNGNGDPIMVAQVPITKPQQFIRLVVTQQ